MIIFTVTRISLLKSALSCQEGVLCTPADTAGRVEEPVHEDSRAVVVWIVGKQAVPLVLLFIRAVSLASKGGWKRADFLVDSLLELLVVQDCPHLPITVARPVRSDNLNL